jgi:Tfp pilus assembly protein PilO
MTHHRTARGRLLRALAAVPLLILIAAAITSAGCQTTKQERTSEDELPIREMRAELMREMKAGGATPAQLREMRRQLDALERQMKKLQRQLKRLEKEST